MDDSKTLQGVADATLQKSVTLAVDIKPTSKVHRFLQSRGWLPTQRVLTIDPIYMGTLMEISKILVSIDLSIYDFENLLESNYQAISKYGNDLILIMALAIHNKPGNPPKELINFITRNFTPQELLQCINMVLRMMDVTNFMSTIISVKNLNMLKSEREKKSQMNPQTQGSQIALGTPSEAL